MKRILFLCVALTLLVAPCLMAGVSETDALIELLVNKGIITAEEAASLRAELAVQKQEEREKQKEFEVAASKPLQLSGYAQVRYRDDETINDTFDVRRARLDLRGALGGGFDYRLQGDFAGSSAKLLDATAGWRLNGALKVTAGQFKIPFSQENLISSNKLETVNRSQVVEALVARGKDVIGNQNGRDVGVMAGGSLALLKREGLLDYAIGVFNGSGINTSDTNEKKDAVGRLVVHPLKGLSVGGAFYAGRSTIASAPTLEQFRQRVGGELAYVNGALLLKGEFIHGYDGRVEKQGWYALGGYFIVPREFQAIVKVDRFDPDARRTRNETIVTTAGFNWFFNRWSFLQVNYERKDEAGEELSNNALTGQLTVQF